MRHMAYVPTGVVDESVVRKQAEDRWRETGEQTWVHLHRYREGCTPRCYEWPKVVMVDE